MIFYFSGTGNSRWVARGLAQHLSESTLVDIAAALRAKQHDFSLQPTEMLGFVFPIHSWGIPPLVRCFVDSLKISGYAQQRVFGVFTCGDECGYSNIDFKRLMNAKGMECRHIYSVQMPNTYICMSGFKLDTPELETAKMVRAEVDVQRISDALRADSPIQQYHQGRYNFLKSRLIYPGFVRFAMDSRPFRVDERCVSCGRCERSCPTGNITLDAQNRPRWERRCVQCLACLHHCPTQAIDYGKHTQGKGRYTRFASDADGK